MKVYKGFTASPGLVLGQVSRLDRPPLVFGEGPFHPEQEKQALEDAIKVAQQELDEMAGRAAPSEQAIFLFQSMMLEDEGFMNEVAFQIKAGVGAAEAMDRVGRRYAAQLAAMKDNAYMQLRSADILDAAVTGFVPVTYGSSVCVVKRCIIINSCQRLACTVQSRSVGGHYLEGGSRKTFGIGGTV